MPSIRPSRLLVAALWLDLAGSAPVALAQVLASDRLAPLLELPQTLLFESGLIMVAYVATLAWLVRRPQMPLLLLRLIIAGNLAWALVAVGLLATLSPGWPGLLFLGVHLAPALFAVLQWMGLARSVSLPDRLPAAAR